MWWAAIGDSLEAIGDSLEAQAGVVRPAEAIELPQRWRQRLRLLVYTLRLHPAVQPREHRHDGHGDQRVEARQLERLPDEDDCGERQRDARDELEREQDEERDEQPQGRGPAQHRAARLARSQRLPRFSESLFALVSTCTASDLPRSCRRTIQTQLPLILSTEKIDTQIAIFTSIR